VRITVAAVIVHLERAVVLAIFNQQGSGLGKGQIRSFLVGAAIFNCRCSLIEVYNLPRSKYFIFSGKL
jgi:hypothetical protein